LRLLAEIHEVFGEEVTDLTKLAAVPQFFEVRLTQVLLSSTDNAAPPIKQSVRSERRVIVS
jgi:hypothetical protein